MYIKDLAAENYVGVCSILQHNILMFVVKQGFPQTNEYEGHFKIWWGDVLAQYMRGASENIKGSSKFDGGCELTQHMGRALWEGDCFQEKGKRENILYISVL